MNNEYVTGLHKYLQGQYGSEFKLNEQQFQDKLNNDPNYVNGLYGYLQQQYGSEFVLSPEEFEGKVKKKDQFRFDLESGSRPIQPTSGSKTSQFKPQKFGEFAPLETKKEEDKIEFAGALPESEQKVLDILSQKPSLKFVEDEDLKAYIRQNPKAWTDELIKKNPSLKDQTIDGVLPGLMDEEPTIDNQGLKSIENANTLIDYTKSYDEAFDNMVKESDSFTDDDVKANPKKYRDAVMNDYLTYLKMVNGEDSQTYLDVKERLDYYNSLGDKLYNDSAYADDLKRYQDIQKQALSKVSNNSYSKSIAIENNYDWKYFSKKASNLDVKARNIEKQISELGIEEGKALSVPQKKKYEELMNQYNQVKQEFDKLSEETNITPEVIDQIRSQQGRMASVMNTIDFIDNDKSANAESIRQYKAEMEANKKAQEEFYNTEENGNLAATGKGVVRLGQQAAKTFVNGVFDIAKMPDIVGEAFGAKGYGWSDKLSETADNINSVVELYNPELDKSNFSGFMTLMNDAGQGLGSIAQFATAGSGASKIAKGLQLSEKGLMAANRAAQFTAAASTSTSSLYNDLMDAGLTPEEAARYSLGGGMVMGAAEMIVPEDELIKNTIKQSFISSIKSGATRKEAIENALGHLAKKSGQIIANSGKETFEEGVGSLAESMSKQVASTMTGKKIDGIWDLKNFNSDALAGGETAFILEMFKFGPRRGRYSNPFEEDLVGYLAENYNDMTETLANTHPEDYDKIADRYKKLKDIYEGLKNTPAFNKLSKTDQNHVLAQSHAKQVILENIKQSGLSKEGFKDDIANIDEDIFQTLNGLRSKDTWSDKSKKEENAVQKPSTEEVLPREQGATSETGGQPQGVGQSVQGQEVTQEGGQEVSQEGLTEEQKIKQEAADIVAGLNAPNMLASTIYPVIGEVETKMDNNEMVNEDKLNEAQDKLYNLLGDIDAREDLTPEQKKNMSEVIENRIQKLQDYDNRSRTETSTTTQSVAAGVSPKTQKSNERAKTPIRTVAEEGVDVTYDGRPGRVELRDGQYVFVPKKLGAVQARPTVIGEAAQVNADSRFAGVDNPTQGPNNSVANITLPNGSTLSILNDDLSIDVGLEIAKQEIGPAPQSLFDTVFEEIVSEQKKEVPVTKKEEVATEVTEQVAEEVTPEATQETQAQQPTSEKKPYTGTDVEARQLKEKYKSDSLKRRILDQAQRIASTLGNNTQVYVYETTEEYNKAIAERLGEEQKQSTNGRFLYGDGVSEIHIDLSKANENTLPHEAIHAVLYKAFGDNQKLFQQFKDKLKPILANSTVEELENFANQDSYIEQGVTAEEFLAELGGAMSAAGTRIPKNTLQKIVQLLNEFLSKITGGRFSTITTGEVIDLFNSMADAFASGRSIQSLIDSKGLIGSGKINGSVKSKQSINTKLPEQQERTPNFSNVKEIKLSDLNDKTGVLTGSDRLTTAVLKLPDGSTMTLKGGIFYPSETGLVWASTDITGAKALADKINQVIQEQGEAWLFPVNNAYGSQKSNYTFFEVAMNHLKVAVKQRGVKKDQLIEKLNKFKKTKKYEDAFKVGYKPKVFTQSLSNKNLEEIYSMLHEDFLPENATYPGRLSFVESFFGGPNTKSRPFDTVPNTAELIEMTTEPVNGNSRAFTTSSAIKITGKVNPRETTNDGDGELFHSSYPAVIESDGSVESYVLDGTYPIEEVFPEFKKANGETVNWEDVKKEEIEKGNEPSFENYKNKIISAQGSIPRIAKVKSKSQVSNLIEKAGMSSQMTEDNDGNYLFYHYSPKKISSIDPRHFGKNVNRTGRDERPGLNISMYYTRPDRKDVDGDYGYVVRIPKDQVYPFNKDPLDLYDKAKEAFNKKFPGQAFDPNKQVAFIAAEAAKLGYPMTVAKWANGNLRAQTTEKMVGEEYTKPSKQGGLDINPELRQFEVNQKARRKLKSKSQVNERTEPVTVENAPEGTYLNVGLLKNQTEETIPVEDITSQLPEGVNVLEQKEVFGTEPTVSLKLDRKLTDDEMAQLLEDTDQMAIPQLSDGEGVIHGTKDWGDFNPEFFMMSDGQKLSEIEGVKVKSKSQVEAIPKATTESKSLVSELEMASNKTGLAKENAVKRFIEKYGEKGVVAKEISDKFDKIQEELGITKICNI